MWSTQEIYSKIKCPTMNSIVLLQEHSSRGSGSMPPRKFRKNEIESGGFWKLPNTCVQNHHM